MVGDFGFFVIDCLHWVGKSRKAGQLHGLLVHALSPPSCLVPYASSGLLSPPCLGACLTPQSPSPLTSGLF